MSGEPEEGLSQSCGESGTLDLERAERLANLITLSYEPMLTWGTKSHPDWALQDQFAPEGRGAAVRSSG